MATRTLNQAEFEALTLGAAVLLPDPVFEPMGAGGPERRNNGPTSVSVRATDADHYVFDLRDHRRHSYGLVMAVRTGPDAWELSAEDAAILARAAPAA